MTKIPPSLLSPTRLPLHHFRLFLFLLPPWPWSPRRSFLPFSHHLVRPLWAEFDNAQKAIHFPLGGANQPHMEQRPRTEGKAEDAL